MAAADRSAHDKQRAAYLKSIGEERTSQRCPICYRIIPCDGSKSRYHHKCGKKKGDDE